MYYYPQLLIALEVQNFVCQNEMFYVLKMTNPISSSFQIVLRLCFRERLGFFCHSESSR